MKADASKKSGAPRWRRRLIILGCMFGSLLGLWTAMHRVPWLGPMIADGLRSVVGVEAVSKLEDAAYGVQDRYNRFWRAEEAPKAYWEVSTHDAAPPPEASEAQGCKVSAFKPVSVGPVHESWSAPGDGSWLAIADTRHQDEEPRMYKTLVHPDKRRSWAAVSVVAVDLRRVRLHAVAGRHEPKNGSREAWQYKREALIAADHHSALLAAFNGGFKAEHGHYGMRIDGVTLLPSRSLSCWIGMMKGDELVIGDYERLKKRMDDALWWRQTPICMMDEGKLHPGLRSERNTHWGATLDGDTVIRRSAIGLSADGKVLYSGIGDHTTARALANGMQHAGAAYVAQLDVNWSYPKFVIYQPRQQGSSELVATKLCDGFEFSEDHYIRQVAHRDFFYLTRKNDDEIARAVCGDDTKEARRDTPTSAEEG